MTDPSNVTSSVAPRGNRYALALAITWTIIAGVSLPMAPYWEINSNQQAFCVLGHGLVWLLGLAGLGVIASTIRRRLDARTLAEKRVVLLNRLKEALLAPGNLQEKMSSVTDHVIELFDADFARIWLLEPADRCASGCFHASVTEGPHVCQFRERCLHLVASSGRYTGVDGTVHARVPLGCYKIGRVAAGEIPGFVTNDVVHDPMIHDHQWAVASGLVSFAGYRLQAGDGSPAGVLALFSKHKLTSNDEALLSSVAETTAHVIRSHRATQALRESEARFAALMDHLPAGVFIRDSQCRTLYFNPFLRRALGVDESVLGKRADEIFPGEVGEAMLADDRVALEQGYFSCEEAIPHVDGSKRLYHVQKIAIARPGQTPLLGGIAVDITERKQAEQALRDSEERFRCLIENLPDAVFLHDFAGKLVMANRAACEKTGYSREELLSMEVADLDPGAAAKWHQEDLESRVLAGASIRMASQHRRKDGTTYAVEVHLNRTDVAGQPMILSVARDVSQQQRAHEALRQSENRYRTYVDNLPVGAYQRTPGQDNRLLMVNPAIVRMLGCDSAEQVMTMGSSPFYLHPEKSREFNERLAKDQRVEDYELEFVRLDGTPFPARVWAWTVEREEQEIVEGVIIDVTETKRAEQALRRAKEEWERTFDAVPDLICLLDTEFRIIRANKAMAERLGTTPGAAAGQTCYECVHALDAPPELCPHARTLQDYCQHCVEVVEERLQGVFDVTTTPIFTSDGQLVGSVHVAHDVSERKRAEERRLTLERQIQQTQKMESLGVLAGGIAHDFNNILMGILGNAEMALQDLSEPGSAKLCVREIEKAARRAAELTRQMLAYAGKGRFLVQTVDINNTIRGLDQLLRSSISKKVDLQVRLAADVPAIKADVAQLQQVVINLTVNASESIGEDAQGRVIISTGVKHYDREWLATSLLEEKVPDGDYVFLEVQDTGCGMDEAICERMFEPFFTTKFTGRGLGLSAVQGVVRGHDGAILLDTKPGQGTVFTLLFPAIDPLDSAARTEQRQVSKRSGTGTVLLVDDEQIVRNLAHKMLERFGFTVLPAADGHQAVEQFRAQGQDICCVLLDLTMPGMDGMQVLTEILAMQPSAKVIVSSGYAEDDIKERCAGLPLAGVVQKPYTVANLRQAMRRALEGDDGSQGQ